MTSHRRKTPRLMTAAFLAAILALSSVALAPGADAQNASPEPASWMKAIKTKKNGTVVVKAPLARVYGRAGDGVAVVANGDMYDVCNNRRPPARKGLLLRADNGTMTFKTPQKGVKVEVNVYKTDLDVFDFIGEKCGAFFGEGVPIQAPVAVGIGTIKNKEWNITDFDTEHQPVGRYENSVSAVVADADGGLWNLETYVDYEVEVAEEPPTFFSDDLTFEPAS